MTRADGRKYNELRPVEITTGFIKFAEGSVLIRCGDTVVLCNASVEERVPPHVAPGCGWVTAEYSMSAPCQSPALPPGHRQAEALRPQRRDPAPYRPQASRAAVDRRLLGERTITVDCDVLQGDGGTRTASVTGGFIALALACRKLVEEGVLPHAGEALRGGHLRRHHRRCTHAGPAVQRGQSGHGGPELRHERAGGDHRARGHRREGPGLHRQRGAARAGGAVRQGLPGADPEGKGYSGGGTVMKFVLASQIRASWRRCGAFWASWGWR